MSFVYNLFLFYCFFRLIESDSKSFNSLTGVSTHSRKSSDTSDISFGQGSDKGSEETEEDLWITWGKIVNEWDSYWKKKNQLVRVIFRFFFISLAIVELNTYKTFLN